MEVSKILKVNSSEFYKLLEDSLKYEYEFYTSNDVEPFVGMTYDKELLTKMGQKRNASVEILELVKNESYKIKTTCGDEVNEISYLIEDLDDSCNVTYKERFYYESGKSSFGNNLMIFVYSYPNKRAIKKRFKAVEAKILSER